MALQIQGQVGPQILTDGNPAIPRQVRTGEWAVSEVHGRYYEQNVRGNVFTLAGSSNAALVAANAIATGVTATAQPVIGVWNPPTNTVNLVIIKAIISLTTVANTAVSPGGFMWLVQSGQNAISTGAQPYNAKTLTQSGSNAKGFSVSTALTGLVGSLLTVRASSIQSINAAGAATAVTLTISPSEEYLDGLFIVPPGGVLALMNQVSTTTISVSTGLLWEEVAV